MCIRDDKGAFVVAKTCTGWQYGFPIAREAEALAMSKAMKWIVSQNLPQVIIESYCKQII
uniref:RNase H type-1 domain-containing protein n=1 Tax=Cajanus cajan TaxID=3821 RepID=A0A151RLH7_CAJCA|nr:hypothetical protein KK1_035133 [Cajanus cajan]